MMKLLNRILLMALSAAALVSCDKGSDPEPELPAWNKNRTATIQFYSRFTNEPLFKNADYVPVVSRIRSSVQQVAVLHRSDAVYGASDPVNPMAAVAAVAGKVPFFLLNRIVGQRAEVSGILIGHTVAKMETVSVSDGSRLLSLPTRANASISMTFACVAFENESQVTSGAEIIRKNLTEATVLVGVAPVALKQKLSSEFAAPNCRLVTIESTSSAGNQLVFVLTTLKWVVREHTETAVGAEGISCLDIQIEAL